MYVDITGWTQALLHEVSDLDIIVRPTFIALPCARSDFQDVPQTQGNQADQPQALATPGWILHATPE